MSLRIPSGFAEAWFQFNTPSDPEPMFVAWGLELEPGTLEQGSVNAIQGAFNAAIDDIISSDFTLGPGHVIQGFAAGGDVRIDGSNTPVPGLQGANAVTVNTALLVRKLTAQGGRRHRGRSFIPGILESWPSTAGNLTAANRTTAQTAIDAAIAALIASAAVSGVVLLHNSAPFTPTPITAMTVQVKVASQRRRLRP